MEYQEILNFLFNSLPMYQRIGASAYKSDLTTSINLDNYFKKPHKHYKTIHVAGTNGKGSVSHSLASILQTLGYKVGLYTSPHLIDFRERIRINGEKISKDYIVDFIIKNQEIIDEEKPSFFEMSSEMAFCYFRDMKVDIAVIEVGMGGRLDSTNVINPILSIITNISLDHTQFLGKTISEIAKEKAGIIKENIPIIIGEYHKKTKDLFTKIAKENNSPIYFAFEEYKCRLKKNYYYLTNKKNTKSNQQEVSKNIYYAIGNSNIGGSYQRKNITTIISATKILENILNIKIDDYKIIDGIENLKYLTGIRGRWEILSEKPLSICDTGHNYAGLKYIVKQLNSLLKEKAEKTEEKFLQKFKKPEINKNSNTVHFILGFVNDKNITKIFSNIFNNNNNFIFYLTQASVPRAMKVEELRKIANQFSGICVYNNYPDVKSAYLSAKERAKKSDIVFIGGSTFVVADLLEYIENGKII